MNVHGDANRRVDLIINTYVSTRIYANFRKLQAVDSRVDVRPLHRASFENRINSITKKERHLKKKKKKEKRDRSWFIENPDNPAGRNNVNVVTGHCNKRSTHTSPFIRCECLLPRLLHRARLTSNDHIHGNISVNYHSKRQRIVNWAMRSRRENLTTFQYFVSCALRIEECTTIRQSSTRSNLMSNRCMIELRYFVTKMNPFLFLSIFSLGSFITGFDD